MNKKFFSASVSLILLSTLSVPKSFADPAYSAHALSTTSVAASPTFATQADVIRLASLAELQVVATSGGNTTAANEHPLKITSVNSQDHSVLSSPEVSSYFVFPSASEYINVAGLSFCVSEKDSTGHIWRLDTTNQLVHLGKTCTSKDVLTNGSEAFRTKALALYNSVVDANKDSIKLGESVSSILASYKSFGDNAGAITLNGTPTTIDFATMSNAVIDPHTATTGPNLTAISAELSAGSVLDSANYGAGDSLAWCLVIKNGSAYARYTSNTNQVYSQTAKGYIDVSVNSLFGYPLRCVNGQ